MSSGWDWQDKRTWPSYVSRCDAVDVRIEGEVGVKDDSQDIVVSLHREWATLKENTKVDVRLIGVSDEEGGV